MPGSMARTAFSPSGQVLREDLHRRAVGLHLLVHRHVDFARRREQPLVGVRRRLAHLLAVRLQETQDAVEREFPVELQLDPEDVFVLPALDGEVAVRGNRRDRLGKVVVLLELGRLGRLGARDLALDERLGREELAHEPAHVRLVGDALGEDVARVLELLFALAGGGRVAARPDRVRKRLEALLLRNLRARAALGLVGLVEVFKRGLLVAGRDLRGELVGELALAVDRLQDRFLARFQLRVVGQPFLDLADRHLVEVAVRLLAVARDERHSAALAEELFDGGDLAGIRAHLRLHAV